VQWLNDIKDPSPFYLTILLSLERGLLFLPLLLQGHKMLLLLHTSHWHSKLEGEGRIKDKEIASNTTIPALNLENQSFSRTTTCVPPKDFC
jgi:hypothetical protein